MSLVLDASRKAKLIDRARNNFEKKNFSKCKNFLENIKGMVFYGVPHSGTSIAQYLEDFDRAFPKVQPGDLIRNLQPFQNDMEQLSVDFEEALKPDIISYAFAETLKYNEVRSLPNQEQFLVYPLVKWGFWFQCTDFNCLINWLFSELFVITGLGGALGFSNSIDT